MKALSFFEMSVLSAELLTAWNLKPPICWHKVCHTSSVLLNECLFRTPGSRTIQVAGSSLCFSRWLSPGRTYTLSRTYKVKWSRYRPSVAKRMGRGIALLFHDRGTRREWVVSSTPRSHFTPGKEPVPILQEAEWTPGPVWTGGRSRPHRDSIPDRPARSQSLYRLSYPTH